MCFSANVGRHFMEANKVGRHFCPDFHRFYPDFQYIKALRGSLAPRLQQRWLAQNFRYNNTRARLHLRWRLGVYSD